MDWIVSFNCCCCCYYSLLDFSSAYFFVIKLIFTSISSTFRVMNKLILFYMLWLFFTSFFIAKWMLVLLSSGFGWQSNGAIFFFNIDAMALCNSTEPRSKSMLIVWAWRKCRISKRCRHQNHIWNELAEQSQRLTQKVSGRNRRKKKIKDDTQNIKKYICIYSTETHENR